MKVNKLWIAQWLVPEHFLLAAKQTQPLIAIVSLPLTSYPLPITFYLLPTSHPTLSTVTVEFGTKPVSKNYHSRDP
jgi:hypothetical protein